MKLNLGCGRNIMQGWTNVDMVPGEGVDMVVDLGRQRLPVEQDTVEEFYASHLLEHIPTALFMMEEMHRVAKSDAIFIIKVPHGASDVAWEDPTHVRPYFPNSFYYFGQLAYHRADYGYRGDWNVEQVILQLSPKVFDVNKPIDSTRALARIDSERNVVEEMTVILKAIKPIRQPTPEPFKYELKLTLG